MAKSAKERKRAVQERSREAVKVSRRSSKVKTYKTEPVKKKPQKIHKAFMPQMKKPKGLSKAARFMELRPSGISPLEWWELYHSDENLWPAIVSEAEYVRDMTCPVCRQYGDGCHCQQQQDDGLDG